MVDRQLRLLIGRRIAMLCEARVIPERGQATHRPSPYFGTEAASQQPSEHWQLLPRSHPTAHGGRRITIEAGSGRGTATFHLTAGEAAELMFQLGFALEQAARDEARAMPVRPRMESMLGGRP